MTIESKKSTYPANGGLSADGERSKRVWNAPKLTGPQMREVAEKHFANLLAAQQPVPDLRPRTSVPRLRATGRGLRLAWVAIAVALDAIWRYVSSSRHVPGRVWRWLRLLHPRKTFGLGQVLMLAAVAALFVVEFVKTEPFTQLQGDELDTLVGPLFAALLLGFFVLMWNNIVRWPLIAHRIKRRISKQPECVRRPDLWSTMPLTEEERMAIEIVPRTALYDELLPGVLTRQHKDVQIVVGDPGSGKTTALTCIARELARVGILPVLVPMRSLGDKGLVDLAKDRFVEQLKTLLADSDANAFWRWLHDRQRVAILTDDLDRISPDGERGFMLRKALADAELEDLPVIVTARPAGVPAGIAASAIELGELRVDDVIDAILAGARNSPGFVSSKLARREQIKQWVVHGRLAEVPFYSELLARLAVTGKLDPIAEPLPWSSVKKEVTAWYRIRRDKTVELNPWVVRYQLLDSFRSSVNAGRVSSWLGIEIREREGTMKALENAALGTLRAMGLSAKARLKPRAEQQQGEPERTDIVDFIYTGDRDKSELRKGAGESDESAVPQSWEGSRRRSKVSAQEVMETAERLQIVEPDAERKPQFRHRIMQAYLAGRCLARMEYDRLNAQRSDEIPKEYGPMPEGWWSDLLDPRHPEKLTANMALTFAAIYSKAKSEETEDRLYERAPRAKRQAGTGQEGSEPNRGGRPCAGIWKEVGEEIAKRVLSAARESLAPRLATSSDGTVFQEMVVTLASASAEEEALLSVAVPGKAGEDRMSHWPHDPNPMHARDPELRRDPDDALMKLTTAADIARVIESDSEEYGPKAILKWVGTAGMVTRWTKLSAIKAIAALHDGERWTHIWDYASDPDYAVRTAAGDVLEENAFEAYSELERRIDELMMRAGARSALGLSLDTPSANVLDIPSANAEEEDDLESEQAETQSRPLTWSERQRLRLKAVAAALPAIVSGLREDPSSHQIEAWHGVAQVRSEETREDFDVLVRRAHNTLEQLVALACQSRYPDLEAAIAKGFRADAVRHVESRAAGDWHFGPGWVTGHARIVAGIALARAEFWYAQLVLSQSLALYAIAGADRGRALDAFARFLHRGADARHPFTQRTARLARKALLREQVGSHRWSTLIWPDEVGSVGHPREPLAPRAAQLLADVTVLLDLNEGAQEDRREPFPHMRELPYCLHRSHDRREIIATGCPPECGWNFCPYKQPPPDEPNEHRGVTRAFCRQQRRIAWRRLPWQRPIKRKRLRAFWSEMERRARA